MLQAPLLVPLDVSGTVEGHVVRYQSPYADTVRALGVQEGRSSRFPPDVSMVKTADARESNDLGTGRWPILNRSACRRVPQLRVDALDVVVGHGVSEQTPQMSLVDHHDVI